MIWSDPGGSSGVEVSGIPFGGFLRSPGPRLALSRSLLPLFLPVDLSDVSCSNGSRNLCSENAYQVLGQRKFGESVVKVNFANNSLVDIELRLSERTGGKLSRTHAASFP